jgi:hypothetical protein
MSTQKSGVIKRILKDHFDGFWRMHSTLFPSSYRADIEENVLKAIQWGTRDLGYACLGCEGRPKPVLVCFTCKRRFCHKCGKKYTDDWSDKQQEMIFNVPINI